MLRRSVGISAICALGASALILPPGVAPANSDSNAALPSIVNPKSQTIRLPCPACVFSSESSEDYEHIDDLFWIQGGANDIVLTFSVSDDGESIELNGEHIFPPRQSFDLEALQLYALQVPASTSDVEVAAGEARTVPVEVTGWESSTEAPMRASPEGDTVLRFRCHIISLGGQHMELDGVGIQLLRTSTGELLILRLDSVPYPNFNPFAPHSVGSTPSSPPSLDTPDTKECKMLPTQMCKLKDMLESKLEAMRHGQYGSSRPCPGRNGSPHRLSPHTKPHHLDFDVPPPYHHGRPHHVRPYDENHYHQRHGYHGQPVVHSFARSVISVLIPVMAGVTVGLIVSFLGLLFGRLIGFFWMKLARGRRSGYTNVPHNELVAEEGKILLNEDDIEPLPAYEDAPAYEETEKRPT